MVYNIGQSRGTKTKDLKIYLYTFSFASFQLEADTCRISRLNFKYVHSTTEAHIPKKFRSKSGTKNSVMINEQSTVPRTKSGIYFQLCQYFASGRYLQNPEIAPVLPTATKIARPKGSHCAPSCLKLKLYYYKGNSNMSIV